MRRKEKVRGALGLTVVPLLFGVYLSYFVDERPTVRGAATATERQYEVRLRCRDDVAAREHLYARSPRDARASAETLNPGCKALSANRRSG